MKKSFEKQSWDLCREVRHVLEMPKTYSRKLCVIGTPMLIFKKLKKIDKKAAIVVKSLISFTKKDNGLPFLMIVISSISAFMFLHFKIGLVGPIIQNVKKEYLVFKLKFFLLLCFFFCSVFFF